MMEPIYITGAGIASAIGIGKEETRESLLKGKTGIREIKYLQTIHHEIPVGEVPFSNAEMAEMLGIPEEPRLTRTALIGRLALREALQEARLTSEMLPHVHFISGSKFSEK